MTIKDVIDPVIFELSRKGIAADKGMLVHLCLEAEDDFCRETGVLVEEKTANIVASTTDYTLTPTSPHLAVAVNDVRVSGKSLQNVTLQFAGRIPTYFGDSYKNSFVLLSKLKIRLCWSPPANITNGLTWSYHYEPVTAILTNPPTTVLGVTAEYRTALADYILWKYLELGIPPLSQIYERNYVQKVDTHRVFAPKQRLAPLKMKT